MTLRPGSLPSLIGTHSLCTLVTYILSLLKINVLIVANKEKRILESYVSFA